MKRFISLLIISFILLLALPHSAVLAADSEPDPDTVYTEGTLYYTIANESITIVGCFGKQEEVTVPSMIGGYPVNAIAKGAFSGNKYIKKLNLPDTICKVEEGAFKDGLKVIYNANTDHPQDTPTELILNGGILIPTEPVKPSTVTPAPTVTAEPVTPEPTTTTAPTGNVTPGATPTTDPTEKITPGTTPTGDPAPTESPAPTDVVTLEPTPGTGETQIGEIDVNLDEILSPTPTVTPIPTLSPDTSNVPDLDAEDASKKQGKPVKISVILGIAAAFLVLCGGVVLVINKKK